MQCLAQLEQLVALSQLLKGSLLQQNLYYKTQKTYCLVNWRIEFQFNMIDKIIEHINIGKGFMVEQLNAPGAV